MEPTTSADGAAANIFPEKPSAATRDDARRAKRTANKNLYGLSVGFMIANSSYIGLQNLQSSINSAGGLGLVSLAVLYAFYALSGFITPACIKIFGTKVSIMVGVLCLSGYALCNYYLSWYTLILGAFLVGISSAPSLAAINVHLAEVAQKVAPYFGKDPAYLISKFTGVYYFFYMSCQFPGNLASSLILFPYSRPSQNSTGVFSSGFDFNVSDDVLNGQCEGFSSAVIANVYRYSLVSVYLLFTIIGLVIILLFVDHLPAENSFFSTKRKFHLYLQRPFVKLLRALKHRHMLLIAPMVVTSGMEMAFAFGTFTELFISECFGVYLVGFTLVLFGLSSAVTSVAYSKLVKCIPRFAIALFGALLNICVIFFLLIWERVPSYAFIFSFAIVWGMADAIWNTVPTSWTGILFSDRTEVAYSAMRIWQAVGFCSGFAMAKLLPLNGQLGLICGLVVLAAVCNLIIHFIAKPKQATFPCCHCHSTKTPAEAEDSSSSSGDTIGAYLAKPLQLYERKDSFYDAPISPSPGINAIFVAYQGRRPSAWSESRRPSTAVATPLTIPGSIKEEGWGGGLHDASLDAAGVWLSRSQSYTQAMSAGTE